MSHPDETDDSLELLLDMVDEARLAAEPGRVCESCGYRDPTVCAMTCPQCDTRHPGVGIRTE
jgi:lipopolysaccharide biosynthesis regulator YciM